MGPGGIATIIASCALMVIAVAIAYVVIRVKRTDPATKPMPLRKMADRIRKVRIS